MENEKVIGYLDNLTAFGIIAPIRKSLIVTDKRVLILDASSMSSTATSAGFAYVFGVFGRGMANRISKDEIQETTKKLSQANLDELLKSNADNVAVDPANIQSVEINRKQIVIKTNEKTFKYGLSNPDVKNKQSDVYDSYVQALQAVLGNKVIAK
jgi:hypothetical protein